MSYKGEEETSEEYKRGSAALQVSSRKYTSHHRVSETGEALQPSTVSVYIGYRYYLPYNPSTILNIFKICLTESFVWCQWKDWSTEYWVSIFVVRQIILSFKLSHVHQIKCKQMRFYVVESTGNTSVLVCWSYRSLPHESWLVWSLLLVRKQP